MNGKNQSVTCDRIRSFTTFCLLFGVFLSIGSSFYTSVFVEEKMTIVVGLFFAGMEFFAYSFALTLALRLCYPNGLYGVSFWAWHGGNIYDKSLPCLMKCVKSVFALMGFGVLILDVVIFVALLIVEMFNYSWGYTFLFLSAIFACLSFLCDQRNNSK